MVRVDDCHIEMELDKPSSVGYGQGGAYTPLICDYNPTPENPSQLWVAVMFQPGLQGAVYNAPLIVGAGSDPSLFGRVESRTHS